MRILHISKYYFPYIGGIENTCKQLTELMPNCESAVVCFDEEKRDKIDVVNGIKVYRVGSWINIARQALSPTYFSVLHKAIKEFAPDVIHFHWANPFPAAVLLTMIPKDVKLIIHWNMDIIKQAKIYPLIKPIENRLLKRADLIIVTSPNYRDGSIPLSPFKSKVRIVQSSIDETKFVLNESDNDKIIELKHKFDNKPIVFFIGRHIQYKGLPYLLSAERYVKSDCLFIIAGGGPLTEQLKKECHSDRVKFVGRISDQDLKYYHYAASVFAFPSITKNEAFGVALAEAMYCYTPAVTFTIEGSGVNWVNLNKKTGIEVANRDVKAYAEAIDTLLSDKDTSQKYANAAHQRVVENFTIPKMLAKMTQVYNELIKEK